MAKLCLCVCVMMLLLTLSESSSKSFCCTQYQGNPLPVSVLKSYVIQENMEFCNIRAVIFKTEKNRFVCADPEKIWVKRGMKSAKKLSL